MLNKKLNIYYTLRFASAMCFIGHGAFGIIGKKIWLNYFAVFGIGHALGTQIMPVMGVVDILMGISLLVYPTRAIIGWLAFWGMITAFCRPLSGEPFAEFIERAGNYGVPLTLLILCGMPKNIKDWFKILGPCTSAGASTFINVTTCLRVIVFLLLVGHGWLNLLDKKGLMDQYRTLGFTDPVATAHIVGTFEWIAGVIVLIKPARPLLMALLIWKMGSELFYPHWELFEWVERGGSYGAILALWLALPQTKIFTRHTSIKKHRTSIN